MALASLPKREPALIAGALTAVLNALVLCGVLDLSTDQLGGVNIAVTAVLSLLVRSSVSPNEPA